MCAQRGKGLFYLGVGILVFFISPKTIGEGTITESIMGHWGVNNVAALVLAIVGGLHTWRVIRDDSAVAHGGPGLTSDMPASDGLDFARPLPEAAANNASNKQQWNSMTDAEL